MIRKLAEDLPQDPMSDHDFGNVLVVGGGGFIGRRVEIPRMRRLVRYAKPLPGFVVGDLENSGSLRLACKGIDTVFHCAGYAHAFSGSSPEMHWRVNFVGTKNLLDAAVQSGVSRFVFLSSVKAMAEPGDSCADEEWPGAPKTEYGRAKRAAEEAVLEAGAKYGMHVANLRPAMVYGRGGRGNLERMVRGVRAGWFPPLPRTGNRRSLVHVNDLVSAMYLAAKHPKANANTFIVADETAYSGREIYDAIRAALNLPARNWSVPQALLKAGATVCDCLGAITGKQMPMSAEAVDRLLGSACYSSARIRRELGWQAVIGLADGLRELTSA